MTVSGESVLVILILIGIIGKSNIIATAACILLVLKLTNLQGFFPLLERRGLEVGLLFLILSVLVPFAQGNVPVRDVTKNLTTLPGILAILGGAIATHMNSQGLDMLKLYPELMIGLVLGSIFGIVFLGGMPTGPLMAAGLTAMLIQVLYLFR